MSETHAPSRQPGDGPRRALGWTQLRVWHLTLLVLFAAIAIADIKSQRMSEPALIALAAGGFALYAVIGWIGWWIARRFEPRFGILLVFVMYAVAMGVLFLVATIVYLLIAHAYRAGRL
jgi:hypothetical protein